MFDIWREIDEKGAVAVPAKNSALSALGWVEIGEKYPELMPEEFRRYDVYSDRQLILESPFVVVSTEGTQSYHFKMTDPVGGKSLDAWVDPWTLMSALGRDDFHTDDGMSAFGGILVCSCGIAGCAGIWSQTFHVSKKMVHWSIFYEGDEIEFFFEREAYERGALAMMRALRENPREFTLPGCDELLGEDEDTFGAFTSSIEEMLDSRPYFRDMWEEHA